MVLVTDFLPLSAEIQPGVKLPKVKSCFTGVNILKLEVTSVRMGLFPQLCNIHQKFLVLLTPESFFAAMNAGKEDDEKISVRGVHHSQMKDGNCST